MLTVCCALSHILQYLFLNFPMPYVVCVAQFRLLLFCNDQLATSHLHILFFQNRHTCLFLLQDYRMPLMDSIGMLQLIYLLIPKHLCLNICILVLQDNVPSQCIQYPIGTSCFCAYFCRLNWIILISQ